MRKDYRLCKGRIVEAASDDDGSVNVFINPDELERRHLTDSLKIDQHTLISALDPDELSRLEFEPDHTALIFKRPRNYSGKEHFLFKVSSMGLFLFKDRLIIVVAEDDPLFDGRLFAQVGSLWEVLLRLIHSSIIHFLDHLKVINMISDELEQKLSVSMENRYLLNLFSLEKSLVYYLNAINTNGVLISKLKNHASRMGLDQEVVGFLDDVGVENTQCYRLAEIYSNVLASLMDARASIVNNNLNILMKTLNLIIIALMVPSLVVSAFSMNVPIPMQKSQAAFWMILGLSGASAAGLLAFWRYKRF
jgi:magnesium transporter